MQFDPQQLDAQMSYKLMAGLVVPRPIGWTSTITRDGQHNLAPFSFFMMITSTPPHIAISVGAREGEAKDTLVNIRDNGEFVINVVSADLGPAMAISAAEWPADVDEFAAAGLTAAPSVVVRPPRVAEAPAHLECVARQIMPVGELPYGAHLVVAEVVQIHVRDDLLIENNRIDLARLQAVGRLTGDWYCSTAEQYQLPRTPVNRSV